MILGTPLRLTGSSGRRPRDRTSVYQSVASGKGSRGPAFSAVAQARGLVAHRWRLAHSQKWPSRHRGCACQNSLAMRHRLAALALLLFLGGMGGALAQPVVVVPLEGAIGPAAADFVKRSIERAAKDGAQLVVLRMDTPGGLDTSMREIIKAILASPVPVASFVAPSGARAASAGTFILYASHVAAMAPGTNLGAASPVSIGLTPGATPPPATTNGDKKAAPADTHERKAMQDAAAYIRSLAQLRGRNAEWGEKAVTEAASLSATEAKNQKVIDVIATDEQDLLRQLDGRKITTAGGERTLQLAGAPTIAIEPDWHFRVLSIITDPSVATILMLLGVYGLIFELGNPGL